MRRVLGIAALVSVLAAACTSDDGTDGDGTVSAPTVPAPTAGSDGDGGTGERPDDGSDAPPPLGEVSIELTELVTVEPLTDAASRTGDEALYLVEKRGTVRPLREGTVGEAVLDISADVSSGNEQGLLGLTFSPDGERAYVNYTDGAGDTHITEFTVGDDGAFDTASRRDVLVVEQPFSNHNAGDLAFGPDGLLYIPLGDGGSGGDPEGNGQDPSTLLGSVLRIDPRPRDGSPYSVPDDNPFVNGTPGRDEVFLYGVRNPWRISFDRETGDLWVADVGQDALEEITRLRPGAAPGANLGWNLMEGNRSFGGDPPPGHVPPLHVYPLDAGACAVTGGFVYRGERLPALVGTYLFSDFCRPGIMGLRVRGEKEAQVAQLHPGVPQVSSFAQDENGELLVMTLEGRVLRVDPPS